MQVYFFILVPLSFLITLVLYHMYQCETIKDLPSSKSSVITNRIYI